MTRRICAGGRTRTEQGTKREPQQSSRGRIALIDFNEADATEAAELRAYLRTQGTPIGPYDVLIAAQASHRTALVTANTGEFARVPGLRILDWAA